VKALGKKRRQFEHYSQPILPLRSFLLRWARHGGVAAAFLAFSLGMGMLGYHLLGGLHWLDAFLNASMILTGMGPIDAMRTPGAKLFAGLYALYSGIAFLTAAGIFFAPVLHRAAHKFHLNR
jgi:hypothetical protein